MVVDIAKTDVYGHACEVETSLAMHLAPDLVVADQLGGPAPLVPAGDPALRGYVIPERSGGAFMPRSLAELSANGALGDPALHDAAMGKRLADVVRDRTVKFIEFLATAPLAGEVGAAHAAQITEDWTY